MDYQKMSQTKPVSYFSQSILYQFEKKEINQKKYFALTLMFTFACLKKSWLSI
jgi:hypothetical protein